MDFIIKHTINYNPTWQTYIYHTENELQCIDVVVMYQLINTKIHKMYLI